MTSHDHIGALLTVPETAERLRVSEPTIRRLVRRGDLPALRVGHQLRFAEAEVARWLFDDDPTGGAAAVSSSLVPPAPRRESDGPRRAA
jgi:excisionase family DNA binding protein